MQNFFKRIDALAGIKTESELARRLERIAFIFLFLMVLSAPHSIAATQTAWLCGMLAWTVRLFLNPRPRLVRTPLDIALWAFFGWTVLICFFSYEPLISINKLRGAALFLIFYFVINNLRNIRALKFLAFALVISCMVNVLWTPVERIFGRGVEIQGVSEKSLLRKPLLREGDTLLKANGKKIKTPEDLVAEIERGDATAIYFYRPDFYFTVEVKRADLLTGGNALEKLGIESWKKSRNWRSQGFYGHYATYAEVLQLIISLALGLFIASIKLERENSEISDNDSSERNSENKNPKSKIQNLKSKKLPLSFSSLLLIFCLAAMSLALLLTVTRASQLALLISAFTIIFLNGNRKILLTLAVIILPVALVGLYVLQQSRQVGFFDQSDDSTTYRQTVYREGLSLWTENPRHFFLGIGMDTTTKKEYVEKWRLFDNGRLPMSHFHSTPIQLLVERGLFGFLLWLFVLGVYLRTLWRGLKMRRGDGENSAISDFKSRIPEGGIAEKNYENRKSNPKSEIRNPKSEISSFQLRRGIILGCFGGAVGFFMSSLVHYNLGDGEVAMVFYLLMGFGVFAAADLKSENSNLNQTF
jgi:O-antigen ligase